MLLGDALARNYAPLVFALVYENIQCVLPLRNHPTGSRLVTVQHSAAAIGNVRPISKRALAFSYLNATPCGRAGPVANAVLKFNRNRGSSSKLLCSTRATCTLWSPSAWTLPKESSFRK